MDVMDAMLGRRSVRSFIDREVGDDIIKKVLSAGQSACNANNLQPWEFVVVREAGVKKELAPLLKNNLKETEKVPVIIAVFCRDEKYYLEDGSAATQNILNAVYGLGLGGVWVAGDKKVYADDVRKVLKVPESCRLVSIVAMGYPGAITEKPARKNIDEIIHYDRF